MSEREVYSQWVSLWSKKEERAKAFRDAKLQKLNDRRRQLAVRKTQEPLTGSSTTPCKTHDALHIADQIGEPLCGLTIDKAVIEFATNLKFKVNVNSVTATGGRKICHRCRSRALESAVHAAQKERTEYEMALNQSLGGSPALRIEVRT